MERLIRGGLAGLAATVPMTAVIALGRASGWLHTPPPAQITANVAEHAGDDSDQRSLPFQAAWLAAHFGYGAACGAIYVGLRPMLPRSDVTAGLLFGGAVWGISYLGILPALQLYPSAEDDSWRRQAVMIAAHAVFGNSVAQFERIMASRRAD
jgi:uncharacterized membrane protein YagU involved in acid resistance